MQPLHTSHLDYSTTAPLSASCTPKDLQTLSAIKWTIFRSTPRTNKPEDAHVSCSSLSTTTQNDNSSISFPLHKNLYAENEHGHTEGSCRDPKPCLRPQGKLSMWISMGSRGQSHGWLLTGTSSGTGEFCCFFNSSYQGPDLTCWTGEARSSWDFERCSSS